MPRRIIIIGAGEAGRMVVKEIAAHPESELEPIGYLDDDDSLHGKIIEDLPVLGKCPDLAGILAENPADEVLIAVPSAERDFVRRVISYCRDAGILFKIVPGLIEIIKGPVHLEQIREVYPEDLLGRETVEFDEVAIENAIKDKCILITGAGGSIGGEIARQIGRFSPRGLFLLGRGENQVYDIELELKNLYPHSRIRTIIGDIKDTNHMTTIFKMVKPNYVYHAAAHKHVHYMEAFPEEAVKNNISGTSNVIKACKAAGVELLVMMSTDKAVRPKGVMGATKRVAEYLVQLSSGGEGKLKSISVRFGNVLGSRGSVVPLFLRQIRSGKAVTITHPEASRYFMTIREACMLVIQASIMGHGGEIFLLRMGTPIKISEIAKDLIALHGLRPDKDVPITYVGLRPGEKLHEDLIADCEKVEKSSHECILVTKANAPKEKELQRALAELEKLTDRGDRDGIRRVLNSLIPDAELL